MRGHCDGDEAGQDDEEGEEHLGDRGDERDAAGGNFGVGGHGALDDEEVGAPVAEAEDEAEAHGEADPLDAEGVGGGVGHAAPGVGHGGGKGLLDSLPAAYVAKADPDEGGEAGDDEEELQDFVIDGAGEAAEEDVSEDDDRRENDRDVEDAGSGMMPWSRPRVWMSSAMAYMEMPELKTVMMAKEKALRARVFSSKRMRRYSGTLRALEP